MSKEFVCIFLNLDFGKNLTGIEFSALSRYKLFVEYLNIKPIIITSKYNPYMYKNIDNLIKIGKVEKNPNIINLYDFIQGFTLSNRKRDNKALTNNLKSVIVDGYKDIKYFDNNNKLTMYKVYDKDIGLLSHINYFHKGKTYKRDKYHYFGYLSSTQNLSIDTKEIISEYFYNINGFLSISRYYNYKNKKNLLSQIHTHNSDGSVENIFFSEVEFTSYALAKYIASLNKKEILFISDKSKFLFLPALHVKEFSDKNIYIMPVIHSTHTLGDNVIESKIKSHYVDIFNNLSMVDYINVFTKYQKKDILARYQYDKLITIPHTFHQQVSDVKSEIIRGKVVYIARYSPEKNHLLAIDIFAQVLQSIPHASLHFYGNGAEKEKIESYINDLKLNDSIFTHSHADNIEEIFQTSELSILTSKMEGFNLTLLESMSCLCPAISFDIKYSPSDIIVDGFNGFLIPYNDTSLFADKIITILKDSSVQKTMSLNAKQIFDEKFSPRVISDLWKKVLEDIFGVVT